MKKKKRIVSLLLAALLCITGMPVLRPANAAELAEAEDMAEPGQGTEQLSGGTAENPPAGDEQIPDREGTNASAEEAGQKPDGTNTNSPVNEEEQKQSEEGTKAPAGETGQTPGTEAPAGGAEENPSAEPSETTGDSSKEEAGSNAAGTTADKPSGAEDIRYNIGDFEYRMTDYASLEKMYGEAEKLAEDGDDSMLVELQHYQAYGEDSNFTIELEQNAFFPYEVQFTENGAVTEVWFQTPEDTVTVGGHVFSVHSQTDGTMVTQMSLTVAGDTVVVYPEKKTFTNDGEGPASGSTLLPIESKYLTVDLSQQKNSVPAFSICYDSRYLFLWHGDGQCCRENHSL